MNYILSLRVAELPKSVNLSLLARKGRAFRSAGNTNKIRGEEGYDILLCVASDSSEFAKSAHTAIKEIFEQLGTERCIGYLYIGLIAQGDERVRVVDFPLELISMLATMGLGFCISIY